MVGFAAWGGTTRSMGDTAAYADAAAAITSGWDSLVERAPGAPLLLWATGGTDGSSPLLFALQLGMHVATVWLVLDVARWVGLGRRWRWGLVALLSAPPVLMKAVHAGSEATAQLLVVGLAWSVLRAVRARSVRWWAVAGTVAALLAWVRPTYQLLTLVLVALVVAYGARPRRRRILAVLAPSLVLVGGLVVVNGVRFDSYALTPTLGWHLGAKTSLVADELPMDEPARPALLAARDRLLLADPDRLAATYAWEARDEVAAATGFDGADLHRYMRDLQVQLIVRHPVAYGEAVARAGWRYGQFDEQPAGFGGRAPIGRLLTGVHALVAVAVIGALATLPVVAAAGGLERRARVLVVVAGSLVLYTAVVSVAVETGSARLRSPTDPLILLVAAVAAERASVWWRDRRRAARSLA